MSSREEKRQSFRLDAGARVDVSHINGSVEIKTADTDTADVQIVRTASSADDLEYSKIFVEQTSSGLVVRGENSVGHGLWRWLWGGGGQVRQEVTLNLPRRVELSTTHVNGPVEVGEVDGSVEVEHVNGRVEVAQSFGHSAVEHVNGSVKVGVAQLGAQGMDIEHVNGNIEIRLKENIDADIEVNGHNGNLSLDVPNITMQERENHSNAHARLGAGGAPIEIKGVNGNVRFTSDAPQAATGAPAVKTLNEGPGAPIAPPPPPPIR
jgi:DUF4097 and DUF4098 domain-containing protein YvlB